MLNLKDTSALGKRIACRETGAGNPTSVTVPGSHFIQEDSADEIGRTISAWLTKSASIL